MSKTKMVPIVCQKCQTHFEMKQYESVNVTQEPELKESVLSKEIFQTECPKCHQRYEIAYDCLYHDMTHRLLIWLSKDANHASVLNGIEKLVSGYTLRWCTSINSFVEKINIFDDDLDDRVVELARYDAFIDYTINRQNPSDSITGLYYHGKDQNSIKIKIETNDKGVIMLFPYEALKEEVDRRFDLFQCASGFVKVDSTWITSIFDKLEEENKNDTI